MRILRVPSADFMMRMVLFRIALILTALILVVLVSLFSGVRFGIMLLAGFGFGVVLEGLRFGFAGPWRAMILHREPAGILAQLLAIGLVACVAIPMLAAHPTELSGAQAPIGWAMIGGAFVFGAAMQIILGCGSGTLVNAGSGNPVSLVALPFFALGSFAGAYHIFWWTDLGTLPIITLKGGTGLVATLIGLIVTAGIFFMLGKKGSRGLPRRYIIAAILIAVLAICNLLVAGQPWGVVYGLGLWAAKGAVVLGFDLSSSTYWAASSSVGRLNSSVLTDYTSLTNIGMLAGAFGVSVWRNRDLGHPVPSYPLSTWFVVIVAGLALGYASRLAFGCNVGAFFSGISTGSLHGWVWFIAAFMGAFLGIRIRFVVGLKPS